MAIFDLEQMLAPIDGDSATGEDLEYDAEFVQLDLASQGTPDRVDRIKDPDDPSQEIERVTPGQEPDYKLVMEKGVAIFARTKDLRVATFLAEAATRLQGLPGLAAGTGLVAELLERYWDEVHPRLLPDDDYDPTMRVNILSAFSDPDKVLRPFKIAPLVEARAIGRFMVRDVDVAYGEASPLEGQTPATKELLAVCCSQADQEELAARAQACTEAKSNLDKIVSLFRDRTSSYPEVHVLKKKLERIEKLLSEAAAGQATDASVGTGDGEGVADGQVGMVGGAATGGVAVPGRIASREDAKRMLQNVCDYLERTEPAHPAPLFVRRAIRMLDMNFIDIVKELTPDVMTHVEMLTGLDRIKEQEESSSSW